MQVTNSETRLPMQSQIVSVGAAKPGTDRANRGQPANSKGGNWWQSPLCGAHTDRHFRESLVSPAAASIPATGGWLKPPPPHRDRMAAGLSLTAFGSGWAAA